MDIQDLRKALNEGIVLFQFQKIDGTLRPARGTTCPDLVPTPDTPKGVRTPEQQAAYNGRRSLSTTSIKKHGDLCVSMPYGPINVHSNSIKGQSDKGQSTKEARRMDFRYFRKLSAFS